LPPLILRGGEAEPGGVIAKEGSTTPCPPLIRGNSSLWQRKGRRDLPINVFRRPEVAAAGFFTIAVD